MFLLYDGGLSRITLVVVVSVMLGLYFQDLYNDFRIRSKTLLFQQLCLVIGPVFFSQALLTYVNWDLMMSRRVMIFGCLMLLFLIPAWRMLYVGVVFPRIGGTEASVSWHQRGGA